MVTIIATCYNQKDFVLECLNSVKKQDYNRLELIIIDNGSKDGSASEIEKFKGENPDVQIILEPRNIGLNKAFNKGLEMAKGEYIMDLSCDDVLERSAISSLVNRISELDESYGVVYSNAFLINEEGRIHGNHFKVGYQAPEGDLFALLLEKYFICPPSMLIRRIVMNTLNGYDESLVYEDFDFWIRSSREFKYAYSNDLTVRKRIHGKNFSRKTESREFQLSTLEVCIKARSMIRNDEEKTAFAKRLDYHFGRALLSREKVIAKQFLDLREELGLEDIRARYNRIFFSFPWTFRLSHLFLKSSASTNPQ